MSGVHSENPKIQDQQIFLLFAAVFFSLILGDLVHFLSSCSYVIPTHLTIPRAAIYCSHLTSCLPHSTARLYIAFFIPVLQVFSQRWTCLSSSRKCSRFPCGKTSLFHADNFIHVLCLSASLPKDRFLCPTLIDTSARIKMANGGAKTALHVTTSSCSVKSVQLPWLIRAGEVPYHVPSFFLCPRACNGR